MTWTFLKLFCPKWDLRQILHGISDSSQKTLQKNQIINIHIPYSQPIQYNFLKGKKTSLIKKKAKRVGGTKMCSISMTLLENNYFKNSLSVES